MAAQGSAREDGVGSSSAGRRSDHSLLRRQSGSITQKGNPQITRITQIPFSKTQFTVAQSAAKPGCGSCRSRYLADDLCRKQARFLSESIGAPHAPNTGMLPLANDFQTYEIIGCAMDVHREKGCGFLEPVYQQCLAIELRMKKIPFEQQVKLPIAYKGIPLSSRYRVDFICYEEVLVQLKALTSLGPGDDAQVMNYLRASSLERALLLNFGTRSLQYRRLVWTQR